MTMMKRKKTRLKSSSSRCTASRVIGRPDPVPTPTLVEPDDNSSDPASLPELIYRMTDIAIARYRETLAFSEVATRLDDGKWSVLATEAATDAEETLIKTILAGRDDFDEMDTTRAVYRRWKARGVRSHDRIYLAVPDPDCDDEESDVWIMRLVVLDADAIIDMETIDP